MAKKYSDEVVQKILKNKEDGKSPYWMVENIEELKGKRPSVVYGILNRHGHHGKKLTEEQKKNRRKYKVDDDCFELINSEESAYWFGFMLADGFINTSENKIGVSLSTKDKSHLEKLNSFLKSSYPIKEYEIAQGYGTGGSYCRLQVTSEKIKKDLISHGLLENKTNKVIFPVDIDEQYHIDVIRGYIDGDGSITYGTQQKNGDKNYNLKIVGTEAMLEYIKDFFNVSHLKLHQRNPDREADNWTLVIGGNVQVYETLNKLYENKAIYLDRKYERYIELKKQTKLSS